LEVSKTRRTFTEHKNKETMEKRFWHYTPAFRLLQILDSGQINLETRIGNTGEKRGVWVSTNPEWENTVKKNDPDTGELLTKEQQIRRFGMARIEVKTLPFQTWNKYLHTSGIQKWKWLGMKNQGVAWGGNPDEWYVIYKPISSRYFLSVEVYTDGEWVEVKDWKEHLESI